MVADNVKKYFWIVGVVLITIVVVILSAVFIITPSFKSINKISEELKVNQAEQKVVQQKLEKLKKLKVEEKELEEQSKIVSRAIPTKKEVGDAFIQLNGIAEAAGGERKETTIVDGASSGSGTSGTSVSPSIAGVNSLIYEGKISLANYGNFKVLLDNAEKSLRFIHLDRFSIDSKDSFDVTMSYRGYYRDQNNNQTEGGK